jgi:hypothetical protein
MMEAARTSETSVDIQLRTRQYIPEDSELHTRRRENFKSHIVGCLFYDAFSVTRLCSIDDRVIGEWWLIGNHVEGSGRGLILRYYSGIRVEGQVVGFCTL